MNWNHNGRLRREGLREDEIVAIILHHFGDGLAGEEVVAEINRPQRAKSFAMLCVGEQLLHACETGLQQPWIGRVEHVADVVVGGKLLDPEQRLAVGNEAKGIQSTRMAAIGVDRKSRSSRRPMRQKEFGRADLG